MAGVDDANAEIHLFEPCCRYAHEEDLFRAGAGIGSEVLLSPTGGLFGGAAPVTAGLTRLVAATHWLRTAGPAKRALTHGTWGPAGQGQVVAVLEMM